MYRTESDLIGSVSVPADAYYGVHTQRAIHNFEITGSKLCDYPEFVKALAYVKWAAAETNCKLGMLDTKVKDAIVDACKSIIEGKHLDQFLSDMIQGGAGTSTNMNMNEVIANLALEIMGYKKAEYK